MSIPGSTPVLIGVGEASERIDAADYEGVGPAELAGRAARAAVEDTGADPAKVAARIDVIAAIRQFEISGPGAKPPFGAADNLPRAIGARIGANPDNAILEVVGGQGPQHLVNEMAHAISEGRVRMALLAGAEAISTVRHLMGKGESRDWSEAIGGQLEDRGYGLEGLVSREVTGPGLRTPIQLYALYENARRKRLGLSRDAYGLEMGRLFAPFTAVAAGNPHAMSREVYTAEELATVTGPNRLTSDPFPRRMVARDQANQGAAVLLTSVDEAKALGVPEDRWVYLHGGADVKERTVIERPDLSQAPGAVAAAKAALAAAGKGAAEIGVFDLYSCFPIAVFNVRDGLSIGADDPRALTVTGGLPFFGGAGNNYSMHAIASMVRALRGKPGEYGLVAANGGFLSKYSVGVYSTEAKPFRPFSSKALQEAVDAVPAPALAQAPAGGSVETYTVDYAVNPPRGYVVGRTDAGERFVAYADDPALVQQMIDSDPLEAKVSVAADEKGLSRINALS